MKKTYIALVQGAVERGKGTITAAREPRPGAAHAHDHAPNENAPLGRLSLRGGRAARHALRQVHAGAGAH